MNLVPGSERIVADIGVSLVPGGVRWAQAKSLWIAAMTAAAVTLAPLFFAWDAVILFMLTSAATLCFGHSVGMHRRLIHSSFDCPRWLDYLCVYLGTLVGMAGSIGMIPLHDFRDWAQRAGVP
jgi:sn-1 stearoyl-lipid 9-desaturase